MKILIVSLVALVSTFCLVRYFTAIVSSRQNIVREEKTVLPEKPVVVTAVGDVMLARYVEELSLRNKDWNYPFASSSEIFSGSDIVFGNFEGAIPKVHEQTPNFNFRFSVPKEAAKAAGRAGVNVVTLANNHSLDFGENGYENTVATLKDIGVASIGKHSDHVYEKSGVHVRFMGLDDTLVRLATSSVVQKVRTAKKENEFLIVAVHFGEEYERSSNPRQRQLAHLIIDAGADVVIGHHPHAIEELEEYHGKPIFYSLGNFIFDQYFKDDTERGLAIRMTIEKKEVTYEMRPIHLTGSQPKLDVSTKPLVFTVER